MNSRELLEIVRERQHGFFRPEQIELLARDPEARLYPVLIRWHEGRASVPAQTVADLIACAERGGWVLRDVSLLAGVAP